MAAKPRKTGKDRIDVGDQVMHPKFGVGTVLHKVGDGEDAKLTVAFPDEGQKKLLAKYAKLKRVRGGRPVEEEEEEAAVPPKSLLAAAGRKDIEESEGEDIEIEEIGDGEIESDDSDDKWDDEEEIEEMYDEEDDVDDDDDEEEEM